jgi:hypothetical protein
MHLPNQAKPKFGRRSVRPLHTFMKTIAFILMVSAVLPLAADKFYDDELAKNAVAVIRVRYSRQLTATNNLGNGLFTSYLVWPRQVIRDESGECSLHTFAVGVLKGRAGIPPGECTIYLEKYWSATKEFNKTKGFWVLVGGDATNGVSHVTSKPQQE